MRTDIDRPSPFSDWLGREIVRADTEVGEVEVTYHPPEQTRNRLGTLAGGALAAMLDSLTGLAALAALPEGASAVHRALSVEYLRPAAPGALRGTGRVIERSERDRVCEAELFDAQGRLVARGRAELRVLTAGSDPRGTTP
jgi:uncharacterized protein (TIGR00369 family)